MNTLSAAPVSRASRASVARIVLFAALFVWAFAVLEASADANQLSISGSMEGAIKITSGDYVSAGINLSKTQKSGTLTLVKGTVTFSGCPGVVITLKPGPYNESELVNNEKEPASFQGSTVATESCDASKGATLSVDIQGTNTSEPIQVQFHYRDPNAKGKGNFDCSASSSSSLGADVCGASWSGTVSLTPDAMIEPAFTIQKLQEISGSGQGFTTSPLTGKLGQSVDYEIVVTNTGNVPLSFSSFTDPKCDAGTIAGGPGNSPLAPNASTTYTCEHVLSTVGTYTNTATDTGTPEGGPPITHTSNTVEVRVPAEPAFTIQKLQEISGSGQGFTTSPLTGKLGQSVDYEIVVTNTGNVPLSFSSFSDPKCDAGTIAGGPGNSPLAPNASTTYTCEHVLSTVGTYTNTATDTGTPEGGPPITHTSNTVVVTLASPPNEPAFTIEKLQEIAGSGAGFTKSTLAGKVGQTVDYEIVVTNTGNMPLSFSNFSDPKCDSGTIAGGPGTSSLAPGASSAYTCRHLLAEADLAAGSYTNTASDTATPPQGQPFSHTSNTVVVTLASEPGISVEKLQEIAGSGAGYTTATLNATVGQKVNYEMIVKNTGNVRLALSFSDLKCDAGTVTGPLGALNADGTLAPQATVDYFCSHVLVAGDVPMFTNTVTVTGQPPSGPPVSGSASVLVNVAQQGVGPAKQKVAATCSLSEASIVLRGVSGSHRAPFSIHISSLGIKQITFYLDGRKLKTLSSAKAKHGAFSLTINPRKLSYGAHTISAKTLMGDANCPPLARAAVFVHPRPPVVRPRFTG